MITSKDLRDQAAAHIEAAKALNAAAAAMESFGVIVGHAGIPQDIVPKPQKAERKAQGFVASAGVVKNQDLCYMALKNRGRAMPVNDLLAAIKSLGSLIMNPDTVTLYLRKDAKDRFVRPSPGVWALREFSIKTQNDAKSPVTVSSDRA